MAIFVVTTIYQINNYLLINKYIAFFYSSEKNTKCLTFTTLFIDNKRFQIGGIKSDSLCTFKRKCQVYISTNAHYYYRQDPQATVPSDAFHHAFTLDQRRNEVEWIGG